MTTSEEKKNIKEFFYDRGDQNDALCIVLDTNIWSRLDEPQIKTLKELEQRQNLKYFFSLINFIEVVDGLGTPEFTVAEGKKVLQKVNHLCDCKNYFSPMEEIFTGLGLADHLSDLLRKSSMIREIERILTFEGDETNLQLEIYDVIKKIDKSSFGEELARFKDQRKGKSIKSKEFWGEANLFIYSNLIRFLLIISFNPSFYVLKKEIQDDLVEKTLKLIPKDCSLSFGCLLMDDQVWGNELYDILQLIPPFLTSNRLFITNEKKFRDIPFSRSLDEFIKEYNTYF